MKTSDLDYGLPESSIAQVPLRQRDLCRLCVVDRSSRIVSHRRFTDLESLLRPGDLLVLNNTRVVRCRIPCLKEGSGGAMEIFLLRPPGPPGRVFNCFFKPARRAKPGLHLRPALAPEAGLFKVLAQNSEEGGQVEWLGAADLDSGALESIGLAPLPPYIHRDRQPGAGQARLDARYYQTIYAQSAGSAAAPTAGLHFTQRLVARLKKKEVEFAELTLHVGAGTFLPVKSVDLESHKMHSEAFHISQACLDAVESARERGSRVVAVGTTAVRVLESVYQMPSGPKPGWGETSIFIKPGFVFRATTGLITNFHQPKSTLLALVGAFYELGELLRIYDDCIKEKYRFLSYGDAMLLL